MSERPDAFTREDGWRDVLVIGGGASGVLFAANLLRQQTDLRVTVIEKSHLLGCGIAYSTNDPDHLLNTRVHNMSAFPDDETHLLNWLHENGIEAGIGHDSFIGRATYGRYLSDLLTPFRASGRLRCIQANCVSLRERAGGVKITFEDGTMLKGAFAVLATGHVLPQPDPEGRVSGAWQAVEVPADEDGVVIIGTGLSMIDQVLSLRRAHYKGQITAVSRRGLLPMAHGPSRPVRLTEHDIPLGADISKQLAWLRGLVRQADAGGGTWRDALDAIRPWVTAFWQNMSLSQRERFLRHCATWWEIHRHRVPPESQAKITEALASGQLKIVKGAFLRTEGGRSEDGADGCSRAIVRLRVTGEEQEIRAARIIDCRGIRNDPTRNARPVIAGLLADGAARIDPLRIGIEVSAQAQVIGENGEVSQRIFALGPVSRATFWEITAIPDIRVQARAIAGHIARQASAEDNLPA